MIWSHFKKADERPRPDPKEWRKSFAWLPLRVGEDHSVQGTWTYWVWLEPFEWRQYEDRPDSGIRFVTLERRKDPRAALTFKRIWRD